MKLTNPETPEAPAQPGRFRCRPAREPFDESLDDVLLAGEDPAPLQAHYRSVIEKFAPRCEYDQFLAELSATNTWRARRIVCYEASLLDLKMVDQAERLTSEYEAMPSSASASYTFTDQEYLKSMRVLRDSETTCLRRADILNREMRTPPSK